LSAPASVAHPLVQIGSNADALGNRFLLSAIAFQRSKQIKDGAVARIERGRHKPTFIAILEVLADRISWSDPGPPLPAVTVAGSPAGRSAA
jgi:DNA-directed RNA polymerase subunit K/omega